MNENVKVTRVLGFNYVVFICANRSQLISNTMECLKQSMKTRIMTQFETLADENENCYRFLENLFSIKFRTQENLFFQIYRKNYILFNTKSQTKSLYSPAIY